MTGTMWLALVAVVGQGLVALLTAAVARLLDLAGFEVYAVVSAIFVAMVTMAPLGSDKLIPLVLPTALAEGNRPRASAVVRFALRRSLIGMLALAAAGSAVGLVTAGTVPGAPAAFALALLALPAAVLTHLGLEGLTAAGHALPAALIVRLVVPATAALAVGAAAMSGATPGAGFAIGAWGVGWSIGAVLVARRFGAAQPGLLGPSAANPEAAAWRATARLLWLQRAVTMAMAQVGVVALAWSGAPAVEVGAYAVATTVVGLMLVLSASTTRAYTREMALLLAAGEAAGINALRWRRLRWLGPVLALFLALGLVGPPRDTGTVPPRVRRGRGAAAADSRLHHRPLHDARPRPRRPEVARSEPDAPAGRGCGARRSTRCCC